MKYMIRLLLVMISAVVLIPTIALLILSRYEKAQNYSDLTGPRFEGAFAPVDSEPDADELLVASYNIRYAENVAQAIADLRDNPELAASDILFLQEMDESATAEIAETLGYNYVYFPAAIHTDNDKNFGTAVLSRWPLTDVEKIIMPHQSVGNDMIRTATKATAEINDQLIDLYSAHTETIVAPPWQRIDQFEALAESANESAHCAIIGGDFNTVFDTEVDWLVNALAAAGLEDATAEIGYTVSRFNIEAAADHIFTRGFHILDAGKVSDASASDHMPVWARLQPACTTPAF